MMLAAGGDPGAIGLRSDGALLIAAEHPHVLSAVMGLGVPCVNAARGDLDKLAAAITADPKLELTVDLAAKQVRAGSLSFPITMLESARGSLTTGNWDFLGQLLEGADAVKQAAAKLPYVNGFMA